jgi:hypothetical protein
MGGVAGFAFLVLEGRVVIAWLHQPGGEPAPAPVAVPAARR